MGATIGKIKEHEFNEQKNKFANITKDIESSLNNIKSLMLPIDGNNDIWKGKTAIAVVDQYKIYENNFDDIKSKLNDFSSYLNTTYDNYERAMIKSQRSVEELNDNFVING